MATGDVAITIQDNGNNVALQVPAANVQVAIGVAISGTPYQIVPVASNITALQAAFTAGPLPEAAALSVLAGATVLAMSVPITTLGTASAPTKVVGAGSTFVPSVTLDGTNGAWDDGYYVVSFPNGGTLGTAGIVFQLSRDAGRNFGPPIPLGTALSYAVNNSGVTIVFGTSSQVVATGDVIKFRTTRPLWTIASIQTALNTLLASPYALQGWGSMLIVGDFSGANATSLGAASTGYLEVLANNYVYTRAIVTARDASPASAWGGSGESEAAWITAISTDFSTVSAKRVCVGAGWYNMPTAFPTTDSGTPSYRRPATWGVAVRETIIPPQRHAGRVKDGPISTIVQNPLTDPTDGFIYHDERVTPGLTAARFMALKQRPKKQGYFVDQPNLMSPSGSQFTILPLGNVMDVACDVAYAAAVEEIDEDVRLNPNGTLYITDALAIQSEVGGALDEQMTNQNMISSQTTSVSQTANVGATSLVPITISIISRGYVLKESISIGYGAQAAAGG